MADHEEAAQGSDFKDRKTGLVVFGILEVGLGVLYAFLSLLVIFSTIISAIPNKSSAAPMSAGMTIPGVLLYGLLAVWFIWMGIGSIKARRWARALLLVSSWIWLVGGIGGFIFLLALMPDMYDQMARKGQIPQETAVIMKYIMLGFMAVGYVIIPGAMVLFYGSRNVKATCEFRDPRIRWTDKCPLPVLAVSLMCGVGAVSMLLMGFYGWTVPFFGRILSGKAGAGVALVSMLLFGYMAWGTYRLSIKAWWCTVFVIIASVISAGVTFSRVSLLDFYEKMNLPEQQLEIMKQYCMLPHSTMALFWGIWVVCYLGYLLYTRRYFTSPLLYKGMVHKICRI
jgi:hypothetical protein